MKGLRMVWGTVAWGIMVLSVPAWGQEGAPPPEEVLTLERAVALALENDRPLKNAGLEVGKAADRIAAARTRRLPALQVGVTESMLVLPIELQFRRGDFGTYPVIGPIPAEDTTLRTPRKLTTSVSARVAQPLSQLYRLTLGIDQLGVSQNIAQEDLRFQRQTTIRDVKSTYYGVLQVQSALEAVEETITFYRELDRVVGEQVAQQAALKADSLEVRARLAKAEYEAFSAQNELASRKEQLNDLLGRDVETAFRVSPVPEATGVKADLTEARAQAVSRRPEIRRAELQVEQAEYDRRMKAAEYIPDLNLVFAYLSPVTSDRLPKNIGYVGLELSWEFYDWGRKRQEIAERLRTIDQAKNALEGTRSQVVLDVKRRLRKLREAEELLKVTEMSREAAREKARITMNQYRQQAVLLKDLLEAQAGLAHANDQYQQALLGFWTAKADFEKALGED